MTERKVASKQERLMFEQLIRQEMQNCKKIINLNLKEQ